jgi:methionyl aminopeptidase
MTLAIEPIFATGSGKIKTLQDNWTIVTADNSLAAQIEHTVLVTEDGCEILTQAK